MPLMNGDSDEIFKQNLSELKKSGHKEKQALAIAYKVKNGKQGKKGKDHGKKEKGKKTPVVKTSGGFEKFVKGGEEEGQQS